MTKKNDIWEQDKFNRKPQAEQLLSVVSSLPSPFSLVIDAPYGSGKSFFARNWQQYLEQQKITGIYFNAFSQENIYEALVMELILKLKEKGLCRRTKSFRIVEDFFLKKQDEAKQDIDAYIKTRKSQQELKENLEKACSKAFDKPLLIIVDELDSCTSEQIVEFLKQLKLFLYVKNIIFIFPADYSELSEHIEKASGTKINRYVDMKVNLPVPDIEIFTSYMHEKLGFDSLFKTLPKKSGDIFKDLISIMALNSGFDFNMLKQCFAEMNIALKLLDKKHTDMVIYLAFCIILRTVKPSFSWNEGIEDIEENLLALTNSITKSDDRLKIRMIADFLEAKTTDDINMLVERYTRYAKKQKVLADMIKIIKEIHKDKEHPMHLKPLGLYVDNMYNRFSDFAPVM